MGNVKAHAALAEQRAAAEAEGIFEPTLEQRAAINRLRDLDKRARAIETESAAIKKALIAEMEEVGAVALALDGKNLVHIVGKTREEFFREQMEAEYPEVAAAYYSAEAEYEKHASEFTFRVPATPAKTFPGVK